MTHVLLSESSDEESQRVSGLDGGTEMLCCALYLLGSVAEKNRGVLSRSKII